jgi:magnesium chelatase subunit H
LLYRKHVVSGQDYVTELIDHFERRILLPVPVFITGVEAHIIVRDYLTSDCEIDARARDHRVYGSYRPRKSTNVDATVNTIGFPLVGGPACSMAGGRAAGVAQRILRSMNIPYIVSLPLLIQDIESWQTSGIAGLQSAVLYALPELDGAIDTIPLGGLVGDRVKLLPNRLDRLTGHQRFSLRQIVSLSFL